MGKREERGAAESGERRNAKGTNREREQQQQQQEQHITMPDVKTCLPMVKAMILLDSEGKRITVKYYTKELASSVKEQSNFERSLFSKTAHTNAKGETDTIMIEN